MDPVEPPRPPRWGRDRIRSVYDRRLQRSHEQWPLLTSALAGVLGHPDLVLAALGQSAPVERDGRVLNPGLQAMIAAASRLGGTSATMPTGSDPTALRDQLRRSSRLAMPVRTDVHAWGRVVPGPEGAPDIPVRLYRQFGAGLQRGPWVPAGQPAIVYFHGGGWVIGDLDTHDASCRMLAAVSRSLVISVGYRLAPEAPFPAAVDDALAAYRWVAGATDELGIAPGQVAVMGDSAGGNLAAVVAQQALTSDDLPAPVAQGLIYPIVDAHLDTASLDTLAEGFFLTRHSMEFYRAAYLPDRRDWDDPRASPLLAGSFAGLPPALVVTAGFDPLRDDGANYARALRSGGVEVEERCYDDQIHGFLGMGLVPDSLALATEVCDAMGRLVRRAAGPVPPG